jgi:hypothetical protein
MAAELSFRHTAKDATVKATIRKMLTVGGKVQMWHTDGTPGWEDMLAAHWANYILTMTESEVGASYVYVGTWPATLTAAGWYVVDFYDGATIAGTLAGTFLGYWDGATFGLGGADVRTQAGGRYKVADTTGDWATVGTWADNEVPAAGDNIIVRSGVTLTVAATLDLGQFGTLELQGTGILNIGSEATVATVPAGWTVADNAGTVTNNYGTVTGNNSVITNNYGTVASNNDTITNNNALVEFSGITVTSNLGIVKLNLGTVTTNTNPGIIEINAGTVTNNTGIVNTVQTGSAAALAAYDSDGGVAKEASVGAIATILAGITSLANWLRGLYNKRTMNSAALAEIRDTTGTFDPTTDSAEAIRDSQLTQTQVSGGAYDLTNATYVAALKSGLGTVPASGNWAIVGSKMDLADTLNSTGVAALKSGLGTVPASGNWAIVGSKMDLADTLNSTGVAALKSGLGTVPASGNWNTVTPDAAGTASSIAATIAGAGWSASTDTLEKIRDAVDGISAGSGLTAQETRNALKLAPSTGTPAAGSVDAELDAIGLKTATIGSGRITYASTVGEAALATIWAGDDYRAADGTQFSITVTDYAGPSLATATAVLRIMDSVQYLSAVDGVSVEADLEVAATTTIDGTTITLAADLTAAQTAAFKTSPPAAARNYVFEFVCTLANTHVGYRTHGQLTVKKAVS